MTETIRENILDRAREIITKDREKQHGPPEDTFNHIAMLWEAYLRMPITELDVAWMMVLMKAARSQHNRYNHDNYVDAVGYSCLAAELALRED